MPSREFHVSRRARDLYQFDHSLFSLRGNTIFANFHGARRFAQKMNARRNLALYPERAVSAGQINAMGLIDEILHYVAGLFRREKNRDVLAEALEWLAARHGEPEVQKALRLFVEEFPPVRVYREGQPPETYLAGKSDGEPHREAALEELVLLWLANENPAFSPYLELFDDSSLEHLTQYRALLEGIREFFDTQAPFGPEGQNLIEMLRAPALAHPHSLTEQLEFMRRRWGVILGDYLFRLLSSLDLIREEHKLALLGPGPARVLDYRGLELEGERFSPDRDWMPRVVMIAKNAYVWLHQLSRAYGRHLTTLDQVPDEELDLLASRGFTALWLIGLWERSPASRRIKQMCGNPEAEASAYSLLAYEIAPELGGWPAFGNLKDRAWRRGLRMAGDMVPNHMGIDSRWVVEHPDWFVSLPFSPFPSYSFGGANLSWDQQVGIYLEDHYYSRSDAAVVFRRFDHRTGEERFIYHGNDGTSMPWNDTAQLDFLKPEVREAVIQTILHVARNFPVIRFDAAMTLTRKHYQRLWYPEPGSGGDIPSRAGHGLDRGEFDRRMPQEFWREVVDRVAQEAPDTLLLAEAFWLLEGYFVRTLGMHRVYNSAFMNMLKNEDNAGYRSVIKKTLEFNPEILKRFVNFMNNPDEETAVAQFGTGDKYFGVCTLMVTLPGLPMFGHGQVEGFREKYGMEYRRAYSEETPDSGLVERHQREIFPLLARRALFAEVRDFLLYDFFTPEGHVNEDVFAYSNRRDGHSALVVYHNRYAEVCGWIRTSAAFSVPTGRGEERRLAQRGLVEGLGLRDEPGSYCIFRDHVSGLEYLRSIRRLIEQGLYAELGAYRLHVFLDFRQVQDGPGHPYAHLADYLAGRAVPSIEHALREVVLRPVHLEFQKLAGGASLRRLLELFRRPAGSRSADAGEPAPEQIAEIQEQARRLFAEAERLPPGAETAPLPPGAGHEAAPGSPGHPATAGNPAALAARLGLELAAALEFSRWPRDSLPGSLRLAADLWQQGVLLGWLFLHSLGRVRGEEGFAERSRSWIDEWLLGRMLADALEELGLDQGRAWQAVALAKVLTVHQRWFSGLDGSIPSPAALLDDLLADAEVQGYLRVNRYREVLWFHKESFEELLTGLLAVAAVEAFAASAKPTRSAAPAKPTRSAASAKPTRSAAPQRGRRQKPASLKVRREVLLRLQEAAELSDFRVDTLIDAARRQPAAKAGRRGSRT